MGNGIFIKFNRGVLEQPVKLPIEIPVESVSMNVVKTATMLEIDLLGRDWDDSDEVEFTLEHWPHQPAGVQKEQLGFATCDRLGRFSESIWIWYLNPTPADEEAAFGQYATLSITSKQDPKERTIQYSIPWIDFYG